MTPEGKKVNRWEQCVRIDSVQLLETQEAAAVRRNKQAKKAGTTKAAETPAAAPTYGAGVDTEADAAFEAMGM